MSSPLTLSITGCHSDERSFELSRELMFELKRTPGMVVQPVQAAPLSGQRGGMEAVGSHFLLELVGGAAGMALLECLRGYFHRVPKLAVTLKRVDGVEITLKADDAFKVDSESLLSDLKRFLQAT
jgi:hypothetical protein